MKALPSLKVHKDVLLRLDPRGRAVLHLACTIKPVDGQRRMRLTGVQLGAIHTGNSGRRFTGSVLLAEVMLPEDWPPGQAADVAEGLLDAFQTANGMTWVLDNPERLVVLRKGLWMRQRGEKIEEELSAYFRKHRAAAKPQEGA